MFSLILKFPFRFDISMGVNTMGALNVLNFAKKCCKIKLVVHISTGKSQTIKNISYKHFMTFFFIKKTFCDFNVDYLTIYITDYNIMGLYLLI
jgi:hypothetical protein